MTDIRVRNTSQRKGGKVNVAEQTKMCPYERPAAPGKERKGDGENITIAGTEDQYVTNTVTTIRAYETAYRPSYSENIFAGCTIISINHGVLALSFASTYMIGLISP